MTSHVNQKIAVTIYGDVDLEIVEPEKAILNISKDLTEEPNEAEIEIYNLNADTRGSIKTAAEKTTPIAIAVSPLHSDEAVTCFVGEIDTVVNQSMRPGYVTRIRALSQKVSHRGVYIDQKTYVAGTPADEIVNEFLDTIALPQGTIDEIPTEGILLSWSFSGAAFPLLKRFVSDFGMYCYIDDGLINITSVYDPPSPTVIEITPAMLISDPQESTREDARDTELHTMTEVGDLDPFRKQGRRQKKTTEKKQVGDNDYVEVEVVDVTVPGIELECFAIPNLAPDHIITLDGGTTFYRVFETEMYGDDLRGGERPTTVIRADQFVGAPPEGFVSTAELNSARAEIKAEYEASL